MQGYINGMLESRLSLDKERHDLFEGLVKRREEWVRSKDEEKEKK